MIRLRVTDLESYRYWKADEDSTVEALIRRLLHADPPTPQMRAGTALAKLLEHASDRSFDVEEQDGWEFRFDLDAELSWPPAREVEGELPFWTPSGPVLLIGHCDAVGGEVRDAKLTERIDAEKYFDSWQWRSYLLMFGAQRFVYDLFLARYEKRGEELTGRVTITEHHAVPFYAYPEMRADVERAVCELAEVVTRLLPARAA